jgi:excisionase family DNA binding protein
MESKDFLTPEDIGKMLGLSDETIRQYIKNGQLKAYRFNKVYRVKREDFEKWLEQRRTRKEE